ncbi:hypothetical protein [Cupriavidus sp. CuC1]|uniref:hypothetical protein n=1 Tax=Cupriavidus sp. CuC1 TaxID=3373131 RepID=UPI0037D6D9BA
MQGADHGSEFFRALLVAILRTITLNQPELPGWRIPQSDPEIDHSAARAADSSRALGESLDRRIGFNHQPGPVSLVATEAQPTSNLWTEVNCVQQEFVVEQLDRYCASQRAERVNDFASPGFMNLLCRAVVCLG